MSLTKQQRADLKQMFDGHCAYCGEVLGNKWHADHVEAVIRKGEWVRVNKPNRSHEFKAIGGHHKPENERPDNYMPACVACNLHKGVYSIEVFRKILSEHLHKLNTAQRFAYYRHAKRFGQVVETPSPIVFYFEQHKGHPQ